MKGITKKIIAVIAAAATIITAMTITAAGMAITVKKAEGWVKEDGVSRRYHEGTPYTGWLKTKDGVKKYCLDGYLVTDEIQRGNYSYSFDEKGQLTGKDPLAISAKVKGKITEDTETITIKLEKLFDGNTQTFGAPALLERWEKGKWVDCFADLDGNVPMTMELYALSKKGETLDLEFYSLARTGYKLTPGFYRIPINNIGDSGSAFGNPIAVLSADGTAEPVSGENVQTEFTADFVSTYAMFEVDAK
ncbi:MAG: hypothetical protein J1F11_03505 [Oscillospiraceae bacterium]|nr:hypothetical protein [Oscillospiraceae bacterium]